MLAFRMVQISAIEIIFLKAVKCTNTCHLHQNIFQSLVLDLHTERCYQLLHHHFLRLLLHQHGRLEATLRHRPHRGSHLLRPRMASIRIHGEHFLTHI